MARKRYNLKVVSSFSVRPVILHYLDREADARDISRSKLIEEILEHYYQEAEDGRREKETPFTV